MSGGGVVSLGEPLFSISPLSAAWTPQKLAMQALESARPSARVGIGLSQIGYCRFLKLTRQASIVRQHFFVLLLRPRRGKSRRSALAASGILGCDFDDYVDSMDSARPLRRWVRYASFSLKHLV